MWLTTVAYPSASTNKMQYETVIHSTLVCRLTAHSSSANKHAAIIKLSVLAESVEKVLLPVQSEPRMLDQITAGQCRVGAARRTSGRPMPAPTPAFR